MSLITKIPEQKDLLTEYGEQIDIDKKDEKILFELMKNSRISFTALSKKTRLNRDTIKYRIEKMMKLGLIQGFAGLIDYSKLGYHQYILLLKMRNLRKSFERKLKTFFLKRDEILKVHKLTATWTLHIDLIVKSKNQLQNIINDIKNISLENLIDYEVVEILEEYKYIHIPLAVFTTNNLHYDFPKGHISTDNNKLESDKKYIKLLSILSKNARLTTTSVAKKIDLSIDATHNRIKKLEKNDVIKGYYLVANCATLGFDSNFIFIELHRLTNVKNKMFTNFIKNHPHITVFFKTGFKWNYFLMIESKNPEHFDKIFTEILNKFSNIIKRFECMTEVGEYKFKEFLDI